MKWSRTPLAVCRTALVLALVCAAASAADAPPSRREAFYVNVRDDADLIQLRNLVRLADWPAAARLAHQLIAAGTTQFAELEPGLYSSFAEKVRLDLADWPEPGRQACRTFSDQPARKLLDRALASRDRRALTEAAGLHPLSSSAPEAFAALAELHLQRGEVAPALALLERILRFHPALRDKLAPRIDALRQAAARATAGQPAPSPAASPPWVFAVPAPDVDAHMAAELARRSIRVPRTLLPVLAPGRVFVATSNALVALDRASGRTLWSWPDRPEPPDPALCADALFAPAAARDRVFAYLSGRFIALNPATGEPAWTAPVPDDEPQPGGKPGDKPPHETRFLVNSLAAGDGKVFALAAALKQETESVAVALHAATGATAWRVKLGSQVFAGFLGRGSQPAPALCDADAVYLSTNLGALAALDAETGEPRWLARYNAFSPARRRVALERDDCWDNNPPVLASGTLLAAPQDCDDLLALDAGTGRQLWHAPRLGARSLVGVAHGRVFTCGVRAAAFDLRTGKAAWFSEPLGAPAGRPALSGERLLVPTAAAIVALDQATGKVLSSRPLRSPADAGNLVAAPGGLISASFDHVASCGAAGPEAPVEVTAPSPVQAAFAAAEAQEKAGAAAGAVNLYQAIIGDHRAARTEVAGIDLPARAVAAARIQRLIDAHGRAVYAYQELRAAALLEPRDRLKDAPDLLENVIAAYPNSAAAEEARRDLERLHADYYAQSQTLSTLWRMPTDSARSMPVIMNPGEPGGSEQVVFLATRDAGDPRVHEWDSIEARRMADGRLVWRTAVGNHLARGHRAGGRLVVRGTARLVALDAATGKILWSAGAAPDKPAEQALDHGWLLERGHILDSAASPARVFAATAAREAVAFDAESGRELWRISLAEPIIEGSLAAYNGDLVLCGENPGTLYRLDADTGKEKFKVRPEREDNRLTDPPALMPKTGRVALVLGDREVRACSLDSGKTLWKSEMPFSIGRIAATADESSVLVFPDRFSFGGEITCLDAATGKTRWTHKALGRDPVTPLVASNALVGAARGPLGCAITLVRLADGKDAWTRLLPPRPIDRILECGGLLLAAGSDFGYDDSFGSAALLRKSDGFPVATLRRPGRAWSSVAVRDGTILLGSDRGGGEALRMVRSDELVRRLADRLVNARPDASDDELAELAWLLARRGLAEPAMVRLDAPLSAERIAPDRFERLHGQLTAIREMDAERVHPTYEAPRFRTPPRIDGRLSEDWRRDRAALLDAARCIERIQAPGPPARFWAGPNDLSATLYAGWDKDRLYLAIDVRDDVQTMHDFDAADWKGDCLVVAIDPDNDRGQRLSGSDQVFWLGLSAKPKKQQDEEQRIKGEHSVKIKEDESGTVYELAIPWDDLGLAGPQPGLRIGLNILALDDDGAGPLKSATWTPGLSLNHSRDILSHSVVPALFGTVVLTER